MFGAISNGGVQSAGDNPRIQNPWMQPAPTELRDLNTGQVMGFGFGSGPSGSAGSPAGGGAPGTSQPAGGNSGPFNPILGGSLGQYRQAMLGQAQYGGMPGYNAGNLNNRVLAGKLNTIQPFMQTMMGGVNGGSNPLAGFSTNFGMSVNPNAAAPLAPSSPATPSYTQF